MVSIIINYKISMALVEICIISNPACVLVNTMIILDVIKLSKVARYHFDELTLRSGVAVPTQVPEVRFEAEIDPVLGFRAPYFHNRDRHLIFIFIKFNYKNSYLLS